MFTRVDRKSFSVLKLIPAFDFSLFVPQSKARSSRSWLGRRTSQTSQNGPGSTFPALDGTKNPTVPNSSSASEAAKPGTNARTSRALAYSGDSNGMSEDGKVQRQCKFLATSIGQIPESPRKDIKPESTEFLSNPLDLLARPTLCVACENTNDERGQSWLIFKTETGS